MGRPKQKEKETEGEEPGEEVKALTPKEILMQERERLQKELDLLNEVEKAEEFIRTADKRITYLEEMVKLNREYLLEHNKMIKSLEEVCQALIKEDK